MNSFNPFNMLMNKQMSSVGPKQNSINPQQFKQMVPMLNQNILQQLVQQARAQGISEQDIQEGLNYIQNLK